MQGRAVVVSAAVFSAVSACAIMVVYGAGEEGLGVGLRITARVGLAYFLLAFVASSVNQLWRGAAGKWLLRNRKHLGVGFAVIHFTHAGFIVARAAVHSDNFWTARSVPSLIPGTLTYVFLVAMTVTSFKGPAKRLGRPAWKVLHKVGMYALWGIFVAAYAKGIADQPGNVFPVVLLAAALCVRAVARLAITRKRRT